MPTENENTKIHQNAEQIARYAVLCANHNMTEAVQTAINELNSLVVNGHEYLESAMETYGVAS